MIVPALLLVAALAIAAWVFRRRPPPPDRAPSDRAPPDQAPPDRAPPDRAPPDRAGRYRRWMARTATAFLLPTMAGLAMLGRPDALWRLPGEFAGVRAWLPAMALADIAGGAVAGVLIGSVVAAWRARRGGRPVGRPGTLTPRHRGELGWGAAVAVVAGAAEEPFFRLLLPLLATLATGSAVVGFAGALLLFGALHRYQGWRGVIATTAFGAAMTGIYLMSGALWLVVMLHILIDLNALVVWPACYRSR